MMSLFVLVTTLIVIFLVSYNTETKIVKAEKVNREKQLQELRNKKNDLQ